MKPTEKIKVIKVAKHKVAKPKVAKPKLDEQTKKINKMAKHVKKFNKNIWCPSMNENNFKTKHIYMKTWFNIREFKSINNVDFKNNTLNTETLEEVNFSSKRIILMLTDRQKLIINEWLNTYLKMYNIALKYIKNNVKTNKKVLNFKYLRNVLKYKKHKLLKRSSIKVHDVDYAIKLVCQNYKSAISNFKAGHIKKFRIRYWKLKKSNKMMDLEKNNFSKNGIRSNILGNIKGYYNGEKFNFGEIVNDCRLQKKENTYYLYVPKKVEKIEIKKENKVITLDPGLRRFMTGITENKIVKIGEGCNKTLEKYIQRKDSIMKNELISKNIKKKNEKLINKKISNLVDELHWQTINYLTNNNETILIGDMSSKSIVSNKNCVLNAVTKKIALSFKFFEFKQRMKYKCAVKDVKYGEIDEWMTSKMCSICGNIKEDLGGNETYKCQKCGICMERDINGARNIYIKAIRN